MEFVKLNNGIAMPILGYGVFQITPGESEHCVRDAITAGYRLIDTAQAYRNEGGVGTAVKGSGLPRDAFFITTKVWNSNAGYERAKVSIDESLRKLQTRYIDLLLIHQPAGNYIAGYKLMEKGYIPGNGGILSGRKAACHWRKQLQAGYLLQVCRAGRHQTYGKPSRDSCVLAAAGAVGCDGAVRHEVDGVGAFSRRTQLLFHEQDAGKYRQAV